MALNGTYGISDSNLNFDRINDTIYNSIKTQEDNLVNTIANISVDADGNMSQTDLLMLQQQMNSWNLTIELQSTITKQIADTLKGIIQKSS